jgi:hypothetical protein
MNFIVLHVQIVIVECPCAQACRVRSPLDELAERLRNEMCYGRDANRRATNPSDAMNDFTTALLTR